MSRGTWLDIAELEAMRIPKRMGGLVGLLIYAGTLAALGILPAIYLGLNFLNPAIVFVYGSLSMLFTAPIIVQAYAGEAEKLFLRNRPKTGPDDASLVVGRAIPPMLYGWLSAMLGLAIGLVAVNVKGGYPEVVRPATTVLVACAVWSLAIAFFAAAIGGAVSVEAKSPRMALRNLRLGFFLLLLIFAFGGRFYPTVFRDFFSLQMTPAGVVRLAGVASILSVVLGFAFLAVTRKRLPGEPLSIFGGKLE